MLFRSIFFRLGSRMRGPAGVPVGTLRRVSIANLIAHNSDPRYPSAIAGIPGHRIEDVRISNVRHHMVGGLTMSGIPANPPENENAYPEPSMFGPLPAFGFFLRHVDGVTLDNVEVRYEQQDLRPAFALRDVVDADFHHVKADKAAGAPTFVLDDVSDFRVTTSRPVADTQLDQSGHTEL